MAQAASALRAHAPHVSVSFHIASDWMRSPEAMEACRADLERADYAVVTHLFMEEQIAAVLPTLRERRAAMRALVCAMCAPALMRLTRMGGFDMERAWSAAAFFRRLAGVGRAREGAEPERRSRTVGEKQMRMLRQLPRLLRLVPGAAQDVRAYVLAMQYWLAGSAENITNLVRMLVQRYGAGVPDDSRAVVPAPVEYPDVGLYHPGLAGTRVTDRLDALPRAAAGRGRVGLLLTRSYVLAGNTSHYDAVIRALEARGYRPVPAYAFGLDSRPAIDRYFRDANGAATIDALVSLTGFSLVGGPAYMDASAAREALERLDVPYLSVQALEFQSVDDWKSDPRGLNPLQATLQVAIPELDGATGSLVFAARVAAAAGGTSVPIDDRVARLAERVDHLVTLRRTARAERRVAIVLFNFPPNAGSVGTAAYLGVFASLHRTMRALAEAGYDVDVPASPDALREQLLGGNAMAFGTPANVHASVSAREIVRTEPYLADIERAWGPAPGHHQSNGSAVFVLGERFGNVFVGIQPAFGYEGDPMRLLFEQGFAPTHAFAAFYRWVRDEFGAHAVLHFGTHGALEFMPGKQVGLTAECWPDRLIGGLPNVYLYAANNPSEGTIAKRRGAATLVSYLTPPIAQAGLYRDLLSLRESLERYRGAAPDTTTADRAVMLETIQTQAEALSFVDSSAPWNGDADVRVASVVSRLREVEHTLIPSGLHVVGEPPSAGERIDLLTAIATQAPEEPDLPACAEALGGVGPNSDEQLRSVIARLVHTSSATDALRGAEVRNARAAATWLDRLADIDRRLRADHELPALLRALDGRFISPAPAGDVVRSPQVLPTGRNLYGFDPLRVPTAIAMREGVRAANALIDRYARDGRGRPETVALVLWGTDNMKSEGAPLAQALALLGAAPRFDALGRLAGAQLIPLAELGRPRIDVVLSVSGVFRDLFPMQMRLLADAALLAAEADEPEHQNFVRRHAHAHARALGRPLRDCALRVFSNTEGAYGANVNQLIDSGQWTSEAELGDAFVRRRSFAYGRDGVGQSQAQLFARLLSHADLVHQHLDAPETGIMDLDQYVDSLGGLVRSISQARGAAVPAYVSDRAAASPTVRTLAEQVALETRTRTLNPRWYEGLLRHGYEGARMISSHVTQALGWSATASAVPGWVYRDVCETYVMDTAMRDRLAAANTDAAARLTNRLLEAHERGYWAPSDEMLKTLQDASAQLEDELEGIHA